MKLDVDAELIRQLEYLRCRRYRRLDTPSAVVRAMVQNAYYDEKRREDRAVRRQLARSAAEKRRSLKQAAGGPISTRLLNTLVAHDVTDFQTLVEAYTATEIISWKDVGKKTMRELKTILYDLGLSLRENLAA